MNDLINFFIKLTTVLCIWLTFTFRRFQKVPSGLIQIQIRIQIQIQLHIQIQIQIEIQIWIQIQIHIQIQIQIHMQV